MGDGGSGHLEAKSGHLSRYVLCLHLLSERALLPCFRTSLLDGKINAYLFWSCCFRNLCWLCWPRKTCTYCVCTLVLLCSRVSKVHSMNSIIVISIQVFEKFNREKEWNEILIHESTGEERKHDYYFKNSYCPFSRL